MALHISSAVLAGAHSFSASGFDPHMLDSSENVLSEKTTSLSHTGRQAGLSQEPEAEAEAPSEDAEDLSSLTVAQLKERLKAAGLPVSGAKAVLIERLQGA